MLWERFKEEISFLWPIIYLRSKEILISLKDPMRAFIRLIWPLFWCFFFGFKLTFFLAIYWAYMASYRMAWIPKCGAHRSIILLLFLSSFGTLGFYCFFPFYRWVFILPLNLDYLYLPIFSYFTAWFLWLPKLFFPFIFWNYFLWIIVRLKLYNTTSKAPEKMSLAVLYIQIPRLFISFIFWAFFFKLGHEFPYLTPQYSEWFWKKEYFLSIFLLELSFMRTLHRTFKYNFYFMPLVF